MKNFLLGLVSDAKGGISSARFLNLVIGMCACLISWKLVLFKEYSVDYFMALLAYGAGTFGIGKAYDVKQTMADKQP